MAYQAPTAAHLKSRYPEFDPVADALVTSVLDDAIADVDDRWIENDRRRAQLALAAHMLAVEGEPARSQAIAAGQSIDPRLGPVKRDKVGDTETEYVVTGDASGGSAADNAYTSTRYGQQLLVLRARSFPAALAV